MAIPILIDALIAKPFDLELLLRVVAQLTGAAGGTS